MRARLLSLSLALIGASLPPEHALACSNPEPAPFPIDGDTDDDVPPATPNVRVERIKRGRPPEREGCGYADSSCDGTGYVLLDVPDGSAQDLGFVLEPSGDVPASLRLPAGPVMPMLEPGKLHLTWEDGEGEEDIDFELSVFGVDRAGNMSESPTRLRVRSDGSSGCSARRGNSPQGWLVLLGALWLARRSTRQRCAP